MDLSVKYTLENRMHKILKTLEILQNIYSADFCYQNCVCVNMNGLMYSLNSI